MVMIDQIIVGIYLLISLVIGIYAGRNTNTIEDYAVGKRNFSTSTLVAAISATMISAAGTAGLTGKVYSFGIIYALSFCFGSVIARMVVAFFIAPKMEKFLDAISSGDVLERLYGPKAKILMGILVIAEGPLLAAAQVLATYQISRYFFGISQETAAIATSAIIVIYCFRGGIRAVSYTDVFQFIMIIIAIPIVCAAAIDRIGGFSTLLNKADESGLLFSNLSNSDIFKHVIIFSSLSLTSIFPLTIQRMLMAKNSQQIRNSFFLNGVVTLPFYLVIGLLGIAAPLLVPHIEPNFALSAMADTILPVGVKGIVIAGVIAIFMSSADSQMNITTVAITQDLLKPLLKDKLTPKLAIIYARIIFILTGIFATTIALYATNALDLLFVVMVLCNSIYFPGYFLGILGLKPSKNAFWIGVSLGAAIAFTLAVILKVFPLYSMLSAIAVNMGSLLISHRINKSDKSAAIFDKLTTIFDDINLKPKNTFFNLKVKNNAVAIISYCDAFCLMSLIISILPFFFYWSQVNEQLPLVSMSYILSATCAALLILRQTLQIVERLLFPSLWHLMIILMLTIQSVPIYSQTNFPIFWLSEFIIASLLFLILLNGRHSYLQLIIHFIVATSVIFTSSKPINESSLKFAIFSLLTHIFMLIICLSLFRKRDVSAYHFMTTKFAHEAGRTISAFSSSAAGLQNYLPILIQNYRQHQPTTAELAKIDLERLQNMPATLIETSNRSWQNLKQLLLWMETDQSSSIKSICSINDVLKSAIEDISMNNELKEKITINKMTNFIFRGDNAQIAQVIINILENAYYATKNIKNSKIIIWSEKTSLFIEDNGTGISNKDLPNIFDEFFSTKGTAGQGLAFCKLIMENHGGTIDCESRPGVFTRFRLHFPKLLTKSGNVYAPNYTSNS
jgi:Na+/proline symporter/signal transduction histidine kinase